MNDYENSIEAAAEEYYNELESCNGGLPCPRCCSGILMEVQPSFVICTKCGMDIPCSLETAQQQFYHVYQEHPCNLMLTCTFIPNVGLVFSCNKCGFSKLLQYICLFLSLSYYDFSKINNDYWNCCGIR